MRCAVWPVIVLLAFLGGCDVDSGVIDTSAERPPSRLSALLGQQSGERFPLVTEPRSFVFPRDHGPHPEYRNEWWYVTSNLEGPAGERFGVELTLFRFALAPNELLSSSPWRQRQIYMAHFAVTDVEQDRFLVAERFSRASLGMAGAQAAPPRVWLNDWEIAMHDATSPMTLTAASVDAAVSLRLHPKKLPVLNGDAGLSQKSATPGNASYYYSMTRLAADGTLTLSGREYEVQGDAWLDREWGSSALDQDQQGWDWFALQLDDGTELMFYQLRRTDGQIDAMSAGTFVFAGGDTVHLNAQDVEVEVLETWESPAGGVYPHRWRLIVPQRGLTLDVSPVMANQELTTSVRYWEGAVDVAGKQDGRDVAGYGYVELTGYATSAPVPESR
ncbi:MAG: lipocalin-like domain-containing protein [Pseudomonadota bacterium]